MCQGHENKETLKRCHMRPRFRTEGDLGEESGENQTKPVTTAVYEC
jgi:hypothetical protein